MRTRLTIGGSVARFFQERAGFLAERDAAYLGAGPTPGFERPRASASTGTAGGTGASGGGDPVVYGPGFAAPAYTGAGGLDVAWAKLPEAVKAKLVRLEDRARALGLAARDLSTRHVEARRELAHEEVRLQEAERQAQHLPSRWRPDPANPRMEIADRSLPPGMVERVARLRADVQRLATEMATAGERHQAARRLVEACWARLGLVGRSL